MKESQRRREKGKKEKMDEEKENKLGSNEVAIKHLKVTGKQAKQLLSQKAKKLSFEQIKIEFASLPPKTATSFSAWEATA